MKIKPFRIPKAIVLPGAVVTVKLLPKNDPELEGAGGTWDYDYNKETGRGYGIICINQEQPLAAQRYTLIHELQHLMVDYLHMALKHFGDLVKVC